MVYTYLNSSSQNIKYCFTTMISMLLQDACPMLNPGECFFWYQPADRLHSPVPSWYQPADRLHSPVLHRLRHAGPLSGSVLSAAPLSAVPQTLKNQWLMFE